jgi:subtilisin-like proprotein convertase family protein
LIGAALGAAALVSGCGPDWDALDPSLGGAASTSSHGGMGGTGGTGASCPSIDDGKECTQDTCVDGVPHHTPLASGMACTQGGSVCDGNGNCVACVMPTDCPGTDTECKARSCDTNTCGTKIAAAGQACTQGGSVCDGNGNCVACVAPTDCPGADTTCAIRTCGENSCGTKLTAAGQPCTENGGSMCDGNGNCVQCLADADCGTTTACAVYTCQAGVCPTSPNLAAGTACGTGSVCDGGGTCVTCQPPASVTVAAADVPQTAAINNGVATSSITVSGTVGTINHVAVTANVAGLNTHSGDLSILLVAPSGTSIDLSSNNGGGSTNNFAGTTFDDAASPPAVRILYATFAPNVTIPSAIPERDLSQLMGQDPTGVWQLRVTNAGTTGNATLNAWSLQITTQQGNVVLPKASFANTTAQSIPHTTPVTSTIAVSGLRPALYKATVTVQAQHPKSGQLVLTLGAPSGKSITLAKNIGGNTANVFSDTTFDDAAALLLGCTGTGCAPTTGPIAAAVPQGSLSSLVGDDPNGTWTLGVVDTGTGQTGTLQGWSLSLTPALCSMAP